MKIGLFFGNLQEFLAKMLQNQAKNRKNLKIHPNWGRIRPLRDKSSYKRHKTSIHRYSCPISGPNRSKRPIFGILAVDRRQHRSSGTEHFLEESARICQIPPRPENLLLQSVQSENCIRRPDKLLPGSEPKFWKFSPKNTWEPRVFSTRKASTHSEQKIWLQGSRRTQSLPVLFSKQT